MSNLSLTEKYEFIPISMSHFRHNRFRICEILREQSHQEGIIDKYSYILLKGSRNNAVDNNWNYPPCMYRQEPNFEYIFGVNEPNCFGAIHIYSLHTTLFVPNNLKKSHEPLAKLYEVNYVQFVDSMPQFFKNSAVSIILTITDPFVDGLLKKPFFPGMEAYTINSTYLAPIILEQRLIKSPEEIKILKCLAKMSARAHEHIMRIVKPGVKINEMENIVLQNAYCGSKLESSYSYLRGTMLNSLYPNIKSKNSWLDKNDLCSFDLGTTNGGYTVDIKSCFPACGQFTANQMFIYNCVMDVRTAILETICEGVDWDDMRKLAHEVILEKLRNGGLLTGSIVDMLQTKLPYVFQPNGIGKIVGLDPRKSINLFDGCPDGEKQTTIGGNIVNVNRMLKCGMQVTIEPNCYFIATLIQKAYADPKLNIFLNKSILDEFNSFDSICIEESVIITQTGYEALATIPKSAMEIESFMGQHDEPQQN